MDDSVRKADRFTRDELLQSPLVGYVHHAAVRFQDIDAAGIIFFPRVLEHCHDGFLAFLESLGCSLPQVMRTRAWGAPLAHAEADYLRPLRFGDAITIAIVATRLGEGRVTLGFRVHKRTSKVIEGWEQGEVAALAQTVHVFLDLSSGQRIPIPATLQPAFAALAR